MIPEGIYYQAIYYQAIYYQEYLIHRNKALVEIPFILLIIQDYIKESEMTDHF